MIDGFLNGLRRTGERVQRRGEEMAQAARLRIDIFQLGRELDALYARLGRAYHASAAVSTLEEIRAEISRVDEEIAAREKLLTELGEHPAEVPGGSPPVNLSKTPPPGPFPAEPMDAGAKTALSVWREKEATRMTDPESKAVVTDPDPNVTHEPGIMNDGERFGSSGDEAARDRMYRHPNTLSEGEVATRDPDPLASKD